MSTQQNRQAFRVRRFYARSVNTTRLIWDFLGLQARSLAETLARALNVRWHSNSYDGDIASLWAPGQEAKSSTSERLYIQVSANIGDEHTRERELRPLKRLTDSFPRLLITLDHYTEETTPEGIRIVHAASWLTGAHQNRR